MIVKFMSVESVINFISDLKTTECKPLQGFTAFSSSIDVSLGTAE
jgi:hypothetical protein